MNREDILEKSRSENKNQDIYEKEVIREGNSYSTITAGVLATLFFILQIFAGKGMNYGLYAVVFSITATSFTVKYIRLRRKHELMVCITYIIMTLACSAAHIYNLFTTSTVM